LIIAELILHECDRRLDRELGNLRGYRYIDDYEISLSTRSEAEEAHHHLQACLTDYELAINLAKTKITELPALIESSWAPLLRHHHFGSKPREQASALHAYFDKAVDLHKQYPGDPVLQYAISRLRSVDIDPRNWLAFQQLLLLLVTPEPATLNFALEQIITRVNSGAEPSLSDIEPILQELIIRHSLLRHSSETAFAVWGHLILGLTLDSASVTAVSSCDDAVTALLALHCEAVGRTAKPLDKTSWSRYMTTDDLYGDMWLLAYEANVQGWLPSVGGKDHVAEDPSFAHLKKAKVTFYHRYLSTPRDSRPLPLPVTPPFALTGPYI
jgi:hypothetical protein